MADADFWQYLIRRIATKLYFVNKVGKLWKKFGNYNVNMAIYKLATSCQLSGRRSSELPRKQITPLKELLDRFKSQLLKQLCHIRILKGRLIGRLVPISIHIVPGLISWN